MKVILALCVLLGIAAQLSNVSAVACNDNSKCRKTDFTTATCENNVCKCMDGYKATDEGCIKIPGKPEVKVGEAFAAEAYENADVELTCKLASANPASTYKWWKDGTVDAAKTAMTATFQMAQANAKFKCSVVLAGAESDASDELTVTYLASGATSTATPRISGLPRGVATGKTFTPICTGYPYGTNLVDDVKLEDDQGATTFTQRAGGRITCTFEKAGFTFPAPTEVDFPPVVSTFDKVMVTGRTVAAYKTADAPELKCEISPPIAYLDLVDADIGYAWSQGGSTSDTYTLPKTKADYEAITCTVTNKKATPPESLTSTPIKLTVSDTYLKEPTVTIDPKKPATTSQVALTCSTEEKGVQVGWMKGNTAIAGQMDTTIQYGAVTAAANGDFKCLIAKDGFVIESKVAALAVQADLEKPVVTGPQEVGKWGELSLTCASDSAVSAMTYKWTKDGKAVAKATQSTYKVEEAEKSNGGEYACETAFAQLTAQTSDKFKVDVRDPGLVCAKDGDCDKTQKSLTGKCDTKTKRCVCASHYYARGNECGNGVSQVAASFAFVLVTALFARLV